MNKIPKYRNGGKHMRRRLIFLIVMVVLLFSCTAKTENNMDPDVMSTSIYKTEWRWTPGDTAEFEGNIICDHVNEENPIILSLTVEVVPDGTAATAPFFRYVNGNKQSNRHPKSSITVSSSDQAIRFSGGWQMPEDVRIDEATIYLKIYNQKEELLAESELRMNNDQVIAGKSGYRFPEISSMIRYTAIAATIIWLFAVIRIIINRKRR